jgi:hypothetical protein
MIPKTTTRGRAQGQQTPITSGAVAKLGFAQSGQPSTVASATRHKCAWHADHTHTHKFECKLGGCRHSEVSITCTKRAVPQQGSKMLDMEWHSTCVTRRMA